MTTLIFLIQLTRMLLALTMASATSSQTWFLKSKKAKATNTNINISLASSSHFIYFKIQPNKKPLKLTFSWLHHLIPLAFGLKISSDKPLVPSINTMATLILICIWLIFKISKSKPLIPPWPAIYALLFLVHFEFFIQFKTCH